jgi:hypothetical protein
VPLGASNPRVLDLVPGVIFAPAYRAHRLSSASDWTSGSRAGRLLSEITLIRFVPFGIAAAVMPRLTMSTISTRPTTAAGQPTQTTDVGADNTSSKASGYSVKTSAGTFTERFGSSP